MGILNKPGTGNWRGKNTNNIVLKKQTRVSGIKGDNFKSKVQVKID